MHHPLTLALLLLTGILLAFGILSTSSSLFAYYIAESVRRIRQWGGMKNRPGSHTG